VGPRKTGPHAAGNSHRKPEIASNDSAAGEKRTSCHRFPGRKAYRQGFNAIKHSFPFTDGRKKVMNV
jgi:hypothetical protein